MKYLTLIIVSVLGMGLQVQAASVVVNWSTDLLVKSKYELSRLSAGTAADGDGALLQLGYFSSGSLADPFAGNWIVLATGAVGDQGGLADGEFMITSILEEESIVVPAVGTPLAVRFFDGASIASSTNYNTGANVDGTGLWEAAADPAPVLNLELTKGATRFEDDPWVFQTSIPVPEPSVLLLGCFVLGWLTARRRRSR